MDHGSARLQHHDRSLARNQYQGEAQSSAEGSERPDQREPMNQLRVESLAKRYKSRQVVKDLSLEVKSGEVVGLLGPNGAGKTTAFYMIVGLVRSNAGKIWLDDK